MSDKGKLYIVSTPIGNLEDITLRAIRILKEVDLVACEDTRHSKILLNKYGVTAPVVSYYEATKEKADKKSGKIISELETGNSVALVTDAGTPGISDPGQYLISKVIEKGIEVVPVPGPSAFAAALSVSGFNDPAYHFIPFMPKKKGRQTMFNFLEELKATIIFYESPHRITKSLTEAAEYLGGDRKIVVVREVTKMYEEIFRGTIAEAAQHFSSNPKGEFVVVIKGYSKDLTRSQLD